MGLVPLMALLMTHQPHLHRPWGLDRMSSTHSFIQGRARPGRDGAFVGEVAAYAALVALLGAPDEGAVEDQAVLGRVAARLQRPAQRTLSLWLALWSLSIPVHGLTWGGLTW